MDTKSDHIPALDGLRGLAACIVLVAHVSNFVGFWGGRLGAGGGQFGVMLFFVLSGFLMGFLYLRRPFDAGQVWNYAVHRGARVLPLFYAVAIAALLFRSLGFELFPDIGSGTYLLTLIQGTDVFWTIPVEIQFYVAFVGLWALHSRYPITTLIMAAVIGAALFFGANRVSFDFTLIAGLPFFLCGVLISQLTPSIARRLSSFPLSAVLLLSFPLVLLAFPRVYVMIFGGDPNIGSLWLDGRLWHYPLGLIAASGCLVAAIYSPPATVILSSRPMRHLGLVSYSIYLMHMPVLMMLKSTRLSYHPTLFMLATFVLTVVAATSVHRFFEAPARRAINKWLTVSAVPSKVVTT
jgi:peptidoglycan/LPS O-acetylase OafA/YrhL